MFRGAAAVGLPPRLRAACAVSWLVLAWIALQLCVGSALAQSAASAGSAKPGATGSARRLALVMGNDAYLNVHRLEKAGNDASAMARELRAAGFEVTLARDLNYRAMVRQLDFFANQIAGGDQVLVFFAGHGVQLRTGSYLLPTDIEANSEAEVEKTAISLNDVMDRLAEARAAFSMVVVDACRDNPLQSNGRALGTGRGLSAVEPPKGQMVVYSASKGQQALDKLSDQDKDPNGVFTREFIRHMRQPGLRLEDMVREVQDAVEQLAGSVSHAQRPAIYNEARGNFYFYGPVTLQPAPVVPALALAVTLPAPAATEGKTRTAPQNQTAGTFKDCSLCPEMVTIPAGSFTMGVRPAEQLALASPPGTPSRGLSELPQHSVRMRSFAAARYAVTRGDFAAFVHATGYTSEAEQAGGCFSHASGEWKRELQFNWKNTGLAQQDDHPVVCVSWNDARAYAQWLADSSGKPYRLLSEAEREYATRAGSETMFWWGNSIGAGQANYNARERFLDNPVGAFRQNTMPVQSFAANPFGLFNVHGNVWELVEDCLHENYEGAPTDGSAWTTGCSGDNRMLRGGTWMFPAALLRSARRGMLGRNGRDTATGFRVARSL